MASRLFPPGKNPLAREKPVERDDVVFRARVRPGATTLMLRMSDDEVVRVDERGVLLTSRPVSHPDVTVLEIAKDLIPPAPPLIDGKEPRLFVPNDFASHDDPDPERRHAPWRGT